MPESKTVSEAQEIIQDNLDHTLFSWSKQKGIAPIAIKYGEGVYLYDYDGKRYLDFSAGLMNVNIGHGNQRVTEAVMKQMQEVSYVTPGCVTKVRGEVGKKLASITPKGLTKTLFTVCGATSIDNAIKLARLYSGRHKILTRYRAYHGATYGAMAAGGDPRKLASDAQQAPNFVHFDIPILYRWEYGEENLLKDAAANLESVIAFEGPQNIAAILLEGESGSSGCLKYPVGYMKKVRELCDRHGILLIADEVMSGFGRTGKWFAVENHDVIPDILTVAKGINSGYVPLGAMIVRKPIADWVRDKYFAGGLTYSGHPLACASAVASIEAFKEEGVVENSAEMG